MFKKEKVSKKLNKNVLKLKKKMFKKRKIDQKVKIKGFEISRRVLKIAFVFVFS